MYMQELYNNQTDSVIFRFLLLGDYLLMVV